MNTLSIGFGRALCSPDRPLHQNSTCVGKEVLSDLTVTCVCLAWGEKKILLSSHDIRNLSASFLNVFFDTVEGAVAIPRDRIFATATHNHSAPEYSRYKKDEEITDWIERIYMPAVASAAKEAVEDLSPVLRLVAGTSEVENVTFVRRYFCNDGVFRTNPKKILAESHESEADKELRALRFCRSGKKDVVIANFQLHAATALGASPEVFCSDFLQAFRETAERGGDLNVIYLQGGCGNLNTYSRIHPDACNKDYDLAGRLIGEGLLKALENGKELKMGEPFVQMNLHSVAVDHTRDHLAPKAAAAMQYCAENDLDPKESAEYYRSQGFLSRHEAKAIVGKSKLGKTEKFPLRTLCFGDVGMTFAPFEMFDENCRQIRKASPFPFTMTMGYTGAVQGYLPTAYGFSNGGYEAYICRFVAGTGESVALELLRQLKEAKQ